MGLRPAGTENRSPYSLSWYMGAFASQQFEYYQNYHARVQACAERIGCKRTLPVRVLYFRWSVSNTPLQEQRVGRRLQKLLISMKGLKLLP